MPLSVLLQQPLKDQPIITANLLAKPHIGATTTPTTGPVNTSTNNNDDVPATTVIEDGQSNTSISSGSRKGSRLHTSKSYRECVACYDVFMSHVANVGDEERPSVNQNHEYLKTMKGLLVMVVRLNYLASWNWIKGCGNISSKYQTL